MYTIVLGREPETGGLEYWSGGLLTGAMDGASLARGFICSKEFLDKNLDNSEFLEILYNTFFNRSSDNSGKKYWLQMLENGMPRTQVLAGFVNSNEFGRVCQDYGIARGTMENDGSNIYNEGVRNFVLRNYTKALGRDGEIEGVEYWSYRINKKLMNPIDVAMSFFHSKEFIDRQLDDEKFIEVLYETFLDRKSDVNGKTYWVNEIKKGKSRDDIIRGFAYSEEFSKVMAQYGL